MDDNICSPSGAEFSTLLKELTVAIRVILRSFNELNTSVSDSAKCKQTKVNTYSLIPELT